MIFWSSHLICDFLIIKSKDLKDKLPEALSKLKEVFAKESDQTLEMLEIYRLQSQGKATKRQIKKANQQLKDVIKAMGLGVIIVLPFSPITLPFLINLGKRFNIDILPESFKTPAKPIRKKK